MPEIPGEPPPQSERIESRGLSAQTFSSDVTMPAARQEAWSKNYGPTFARWYEREMTPAYGPDGRMYAPSKWEAGSYLLPEDANKLYGIQGHLTFDKPVPEPVAIELQQLKHEELQRKFILDRRTPGFWHGAALFGTQAAMTFADPLNVAAAFIPVVGEARYAQLLANASSPLARAGVRGVVGGAEGLVGTAALEPTQLYMMRQEQADYDAVDSMLNVAFGTVLGGTLRAGGGAMADWVGRLSLSAKERAFRAGLVDAAETGTMEQPAKMLQPDLLGAIPAEGHATTAGGQRIQTRLELIEADDIITSHDSDFNVNPAYPAELQPRDRSGKAAQVQVAKIAADLDPERLGPQVEADRGAPILGPDNVTWSGNGRVLGLRRAGVENQPGIEAYRNYLKGMGWNLEGYRNPIMVRRAVTELSQAERIRFAAGGNVGAILELNAVERAAADARKLDAPLLSKMKPGEVGSLGNADFVRGFVDTLAQSEQGGMVDASGRLSQSGLARLENALLARAFPDAGLLGRLLESRDENLRAIGGALRDVAPEWARMRAEYEAGKLAPGVDITDSLIAAVRMVDDARAKGAKMADVLAQVDAFGNDMARGLVRLMYRDATLLQPKGREALARELKTYAEHAMRATRDETMFGSALKPVTADDILDMQRAKSDAEIAAELRYGESRIKPPDEAIPAQVKALEIQIIDGIARAFPPPDDEAKAAAQAAEKAAKRTEAVRRLGEAREELQALQDARAPEPTPVQARMIDAKQAEIARLEGEVAAADAAPEAAPGGAPGEAPKPGEAAPAKPPEPGSPEAQAAQAAGDIERVKAQIDAAAKDGNPDAIEVRVVLAELDEIDLEAAGRGEAAQMAAACLLSANLGEV